MNKRSTLADKAFAAFDELLDIEELVLDKCMVALGYDPDRTTSWPFSFLEIEYETKSIIFNESKEDLTLTEQQQSALWEIGFVNAVVESQDSDVATIYTSQLDSK